MAKSREKLGFFAALAAITSAGPSPVGILFRLLGVVLISGLATGYQRPQTALTGHTGQKYDWSSVVTFNGYSRLQGAMIPRQCQAGVIIQPTSQAEVVQAINKATTDCAAASGGTQRLSIRGSRQLYHASSDILCPAASSSVIPACSVVLDLEKLGGVKSLNKTGQVVTVGPTLLLYDLLNWLEPYELSLDYMNLPFYSNLTIAGMLLTAAHGSSRTKPSSFADIVTSVTFVDAKGVVHTSTDIPNIVGSNGLYGIITEMVVKVVPIYKIKALPRRVKDKTLRANLQNILADPNLVLIQWLPDVMQAIVMTREKVPASKLGHAKFQVLDSQPLVAAAAGPSVGLQQVDNALLGNRLLLDDLPLCLAEIVLIPYHRTEKTRIPIPFGVPAIGRAAVMASSNCVPGPNFGCLWRNIAIDLREIDIPVTVLAAWMDDVRSIIRRSVPTCLPSVIGFAMRFGQATTYPLDMSYKRDTVYIDIVSNKAPALVDAASSYQHVFDEIEQLSFCKYGARAHWGKNSNRQFANSRCPGANQYPELEAAIARTKPYDPDGIFVSPLLDTFLKRQSLPKTPGCAIRAQCYCDADVDCGPKYACVPGDTFPEFKVCKSQVLSLKHDLMARAREGLTGWMG